MIILSDVGEAAELIHKLRVALQAVLEDVRALGAELDPIILERAEQALEETK